MGKNDKKATKKKKKIGPYTGLKIKSYTWKM